jgi:DNA-binding CsgD family transcriptional regulator
MTAKFPLFDSEGRVSAVGGVCTDITAHKKVEEALKKAHDELEQRVIDRTAQLNQKTERLMETNVALKILLEKREEDKKELEKKVIFNIEKLIYPYLEKLKMRCDEGFEGALIKIIQSNLDEITSSFTQNHKNYLSNLTPAQIQIADFIKQGHTTKEIASLLNLSPSTIACHRQEIRKRLSLTHKKTNLQTALTTNCQ